MTDIGFKNVLGFALLISIIATFIYVSYTGIPPFPTQNPNENLDNFTYYGEASQNHGIHIYRDDVRNVTIYEISGEGIDTIPDWQLQSPNKS